MKPDPQALQRPEQSVASRSQESTGGIFLPPHERHRMATETKIRIRRNPYSDNYEVELRTSGGVLVRRAFENHIDLAHTLAATGDVSDEEIEAASDVWDSMNRGEPEYPLGVSYRPVAEAVCDCETCRSFPAKERKPTGAIRENVIFWFKGMFWVGAVIVPWVGGFHFVCWAGGW